MQMAASFVNSVAIQCRNLLLVCPLLTCFAVDSLASTFDTPLSVVTAKAAVGPNSGEVKVVCKEYRDFTIKEVQDSDNVGSEQSVWVGDSAKGRKCTAAKQPDELVPQTGDLAVYFLGARGPIAFYAEADPNGIGELVYAFRLPDMKPVFQEKVLMGRTDNDPLAIRAMRETEDGLEFEFDRVGQLDCSIWSSWARCADQARRLSGHELAQALCRRTYEDPQAPAMPPPPPEGDEATWGGSASPHERPQAALPPPPEGVEETWDGPAFPQEHLARKEPSSTCKPDDKPCHQKVLDNTRTMLRTDAPEIAFPAKAVIGKGQVTIENIGAPFRCTPLP